RATMQTFCNRGRTASGLPSPATKTQSTRPSGHSGLLKSRRSGMTARSRTETFRSVARAGRARKIRSLQSKILSAGISADLTKRQRLFGKVIRPKAKILFPAILTLLISPVLGADFTYKEYAKAPDAWKRGFLFGMSQYMSSVARPDEEPPYPVRTAFKRCLGPAADSTLVRHVDAYVAA